MGGARWAYVEGALHHSKFPRVHPHRDAHTPMMACRPPSAMKAAHVEGALHSSRAAPRPAIPTAISTGTEFLLKAGARPHLLSGAGTGQGQWTG
eukprot:1157834-Pelagomonas_calceolata.AAC.21